MLEFRKMHHDGTWHWSPKCAGWPGTNFQMFFGEASPEGANCSECAQKTGSHSR
jgi:hypothetical protein